MWYIVSLVLFGYKFESVWGCLYAVPSLVSPVGWLIDSCLWTSIFTENRCYISLTSRRKCPLSKVNSFLQHFQQPFNLSLSPDQLSWYYRWQIFALDWSWICWAHFGIIDLAMLAYWQSASLGSGCFLHNRPYAQFLHKPSVFTLTLIFQGFSQAV